MSGEVVTYERTVVPDGQVTVYQEQQRTGRTPEQQRNLSAVESHARHLGKLRDAHPNGLVTSEQFVSSPAHVAFDYGYPIPAGMRYDPQELTDMLSVAHAVDPQHVHGQFVYAVLVELGRRLK
jgi:hypothetical protein